MLKLLNICTCNRGRAGSDPGQAGSACHCSLLLPGAPPLSTGEHPLKPQVKSLPQREFSKAQNQRRNSPWWHPQPRSTGVQAVNSTGPLSQGTQGQGRNSWAWGQGRQGTRGPFPTAPKCPGPTERASSMSNKGFTHWGSSHAVAEHFQGSHNGTLLCSLMQEGVNLS